MFGFKILRTNINNDIIKRHELILSKINLDFVIDVGSNNGQFLREYSNIFSGLEVIAIEPIKKYNQHISKIPRYSNIRILNKVVGKNNSRIIFHETENDVFSSALKPSKLFVKKTKGIKTKKKLIEKCIGLDEVIDLYCKGSKKIFLKIDVQGFERDVLNSIENNINKLYAIKIEASFQQLYENQILFDELLKHKVFKNFYLADISHVSSDLTNGRILQVDLFFLKK